MDLKSMIEIGGKIEIILKRDHVEDLRSFSMIQDISNEGDLIVTLPMLEGRPILLNPADRIEIYFFKEEASFLFHGRVKKRFRINNAVVVSITRTSPIQRIQRREFYRLRVILPVDFWLLDDDIEDKPTVYKGYSIDISGGGLKLNTDYCLEVNTAIECRIDLGNERQLQIKGKVIRVNPAGGSGYRYELGISFCCVSHRVREDLIRFIFSKQRELREKGLI